MIRSVRHALRAAILLLPAAAAAQDASLDNRLRDLLHQTTEQLRAAQDNAATLQAQLDTVTRQRDALQAALDQAKAQPAVTPQQQAALKQAQSQAEAAKSQIASANAEAARLQKAYQDATRLAQQKDASDRRNAAGFKQTSAALALCRQENTKLTGIAEDILHLYQTPSFNTLLIANHDRLLGFARVKLQNLVQDYEDRIDAEVNLEPAPKP